MRGLIFLASIILLNSCSQSSNKEKANHKDLLFDAALIEEIESSFSKREINGCFVLHDMGKGTSIVYNKERAEQPFLPASTYKILNSLIALECGLVKDENEVIKWDGIERSVSIWNQDHNMKTGIKNSVVWLYQELARRIGEERMQSYVNLAGYGNQQIGRGIDNFWLVGELHITPLEQVDFLTRFVEEDLPFAKENIRIVKEILIEDRSDSYIFRAKTGWADFGTPVGWYIGYIEIEEAKYIFVNNIKIRDNDDAGARKEITKEVFNTVFNIELKI